MNRRSACLPALVVAYGITTASADQFPVCVGESSRTARTSRVQSIVSPSKSARFDTKFASSGKRVSVGGTQVVGRKGVVSGRLGASVGPIGMVTIPVGTPFQMGSPDTESGRSTDERQWRVTLTRPFAICDHEVTWAEYTMLVENPADTPGDPALPVSMVSWDEAVSFCEKLTRSEQAAGRLPAGKVYRLPTEAEWEFAARAGTLGPRYGDLNRIAWWAGNAGAQVQPPKTRLANTFQLFDMIGNVSEWCHDRYGDYPAEPMSDPTGPLTETRRVVRGGSWSDGDRSSRAAWRGKQYNSTRLPTVGFRIVRGLPVSR